MPGLLEMLRRYRRKRAERREEDEANAQEPEAMEPTAYQVPYDSATPDPAATILLRLRT